MHHRGGGSRAGIADTRQPGTGATCGRARGTRTGGGSFGAAQARVPLDRSARSTGATFCRYGAGDLSLGAPNKWGQPATGRSRTGDLALHLLRPGQAAAAVRGAQRGSTTRSAHRVFGRGVRSPPTRPGTVTPVRDCGPTLNEVNPSGRLSSGGIDDEDTDLGRFDDAAARSGRGTGSCERWNSQCAGVGQRSTRRTARAWLRLGTSALGVPQRNPGLSTRLLATGGSAAAATGGVRERLSAPTSSSSISRRHHPWSRCGRPCPMRARSGLRATGTGKTGATTGCAATGHVLAPATSGRRRAGSAREIGGPATAVAGNETIATAGTIVARVDTAATTMTMTIVATLPTATATTSAAIGDRRTPL